MSNYAQGASAPTAFPYTTTEIRVFVIEGEPWFVANDVCAVLEFAHPASNLRRLDDDEKGVHTMHTPGGPQEMTIINESGLYSLILTSRKPEAKKFKKWVTSEVLPAIRKTGRYVHPEATQPAPAEAPELFSSADQQNLQRLVWLITHRFHFKHAFVQAVWYALRAITGNPSPSRFQVNHIPPLAAELRRIFAITGTLSEAISEAEGMVIKRILRHGENAEKVLAEAKAMLLKAAGEEATELNVCLSRWDEHEIAQFVTRDRRGHGSSYADVQEKLFH